MDLSYMERVHCQVILTFWPSVLKIWHSPCKFCMAHCSQTTNGNSFIFSGHINLPWDLCTIVLFWHLTLTLCPVRPLPWISCPDHCLEIINDYCFIFSEHISITWHLCTVESLWPFDLDIMTVTVKILSGPLLSNYSIQMTSASYFQGISS